MKALLQRLAASFRLRLTFFLVLVMGVLIGAYGYAVSRKLEAYAIERVERRLMGVASRWTPLPMRTPETGRPGPSPREHRERSVYLGILSAEGEWIPGSGDWPEALVTAWRKVVATKGSTWPQIVLPERPPPVHVRPVAGRRPGPFEGLPPQEMNKFTWLELSAEGEPWLVLTGRLERGFVVFADNIRNERATATDLGRVQTIYLPLLMLVVLVIGWIFSTRALARSIDWRRRWSAPPTETSVISCR